MEYNAMDMAKYIIFYSNEKNYGITNLRLQKILYFVQLYFLKIRREVCFIGDIEAWDFGPVVPKVFRKYIRFGSGWIPLFEDPCVHFDSEVDRQIVEGVVDLLSSYSHTRLTGMAVSQRPYRRAHGGIITVSMVKDWIQEKEIYT